MKPRARRLAAIAAWINENLPALEARIERSYCNTDRKVGRLRWPGKGRHGNKIIVTERATGSVLLDHDGAQTYRTNAEVERWLGGYLARRSDGAPG